MNSPFFFVCVLPLLCKGQISLFEGQSCKWWDVWSWQTSLTVTCVKEYCFSLKWCCLVHSLLLEEFLFLSKQRTDSKRQFCTVKGMEKMGINCDISSVSSWVIKSWKAHYMSLIHVRSQCFIYYVDVGLSISWVLLENL